MVALRTAAPTSVEPTRNSPESWPAQELESVDHCPLCGCVERTELYRDLIDRVFFLRIGEVVSLSVSRMRRRLPRPPANSGKHRARLRFVLYSRLASGRRQRAAERLRASK